MLSLSAAKDGVILPSEEDRKRIITQMKVRTTLKGDKSWIQQRRSDSEDEQNHSTLYSPQRTRTGAGISPASQQTLPSNDRVASTEHSSQREPLSPPALKSPSKKSPTTPAPSGYLIRGVFMKTVDKTSPSNPTSNGSQKSPKMASLPRFSQGYKMTTDEYKKLAPYNIKREISDPGEVEPSVSPDEQKKRTEAASSVLRRTANRERSYVLSAAKKSNGGPSQEGLPLVARRIVEEDDVAPRSRSQTMPASAWFNSRGKSNTNGERRATGGTTWNESKIASVAPSTSIDTTTSRSQTSKPYEESSYSTFNHLESPVASEKHDRNSQTTPCAETRRVLFSDESRSTSRHRTEVADSTAEMYHRSKIEEAPHDTEFGSPRAQSFTRNSKDEDDLPGVRYHVPIHLDNDREADSKKTISGFEQKSPREEAYESPSDNEYKKVEAYLAKSSSVSMESGIATPESSQGEAGSDPDTARAVPYGTPEVSLRIPSYPDNPDPNFPMRDRCHSATLSHRGHQTNNTTRSSQTGLGTPSYRYNQRYNTNMLETSHGRASHHGNQASCFGSGVCSPFRDGPMSGSPRSHRMPFYKDTCDRDNKSKGLLFVKESVNSTELSSSPRYNSRSLVDLSELEKISRSSASYLNSSPLKRTPEDLCTYCGREIRNCAKITIDNLKICCHEYCFRCGICHKPMGDLLDKIFIHRDIVHCDKCYEKLF
ncbi:hypothetical protein JRQ81_007181 [Phrynocephalus forsythii]|uniref:LIM zinc-binding domain-containing protein n=1 Tax=Phrynocephalus forsythii TaxID=171643 RepID=A0A9Q1ATZ0_9SAUR|nr:hypothetical protein JRQ81_007181 [Phrynocephalus forsythii]